MARLDYAILPDWGGDPALAPLAEQIVKERGRLLNLHRMLSHSPPVAAGFLEPGNGVRG